MYNDMHILPKIILTALAILTANTGIAQTDDATRAHDAEVLKIAALEALISAPPERALPLVTKVLAGGASDEVKSRALFVLSQIDLPEAQLLLLDTVRGSDRELSLESIRMIGIGGHEEALAGLADIYRDGDAVTKESVLQAYLIAGDANAVYEIASSADDDEEFDAALNILGAMGATDELRKLRDRDGNSESLIHAYAIAGDFDSLHTLATDGSDTERQLHAIHGLSIVGGDRVAGVLMGIYRDTGSTKVREGALHGLFVAGHDEGVLELFRESDNVQEKGEMLRILVMMDSDHVLEVIDEALGDDL